MQIKNGTLLGIAYRLMKNKKIKLDDSVKALLKDNYKYLKYTFNPKVADLDTVEIYKDKYEAFRQHKQVTNESETKIYELKPLWKGQSPFEAFKEYVQSGGFDQNWEETTGGWDWPWSKKKPVKESPSPEKTVRINTETQKYSQNKISRLKATRENEQVITEIFRKVHENIPDIWETLIPLHNNDIILRREVAAILTMSDGNFVKKIPQILSQNMYNKYKKNKETFQKMEYEANNTLGLYKYDHQLQQSFQNLIKNFDTRINLVYKFQFSIFCGTLLRLINMYGTKGVYEEIDRDIQSQVTKQIPNYRRALNTDVLRFKYQKRQELLQKHPFVKKMHEHYSDIFKAISHFVANKELHTYPIQKISDNIPLYL